MKYLITGGTGSFGHAMAQALSGNDITIFSRDEEKQHRMRLEHPEYMYEIGDVRDRNRVFEVMKGVDYVFHAAALKQVPSCEFFPSEAVQTNVHGTENVLDAAIANDVSKVVCLSTDKAVYPINSMGMSKALMEKVAIAKSRNTATEICITRYGNVMCSRGSIIPIWAEAAKAGKPLFITDPTMTRFLLSIDDAIELVNYAFLNGKTGDTFIKKAPASTMQTLAEAVRIKHNSRSYIQPIGIRHGEKLHETLISSEEMIRAEDCGDYYRIKSDTRDLNYDKFFTDGVGLEMPVSYSSNTTKILDVEDVGEIIDGLESA